jgi:uncharacterized oligopeptide transporter (OPT) family protein
LPPEPAAGSSQSGSAPSAAPSALPGAHAVLPPLDLTIPQFTLRAVLTGMLLGAVLSSCNIYTGLLIGWSFNMSITAALISYGFWSALRFTAQTRSWNILENNINQTVASSAASVSSAGLVAPIPALTMLTGQTLPWHWMSLWVFSVCLVGITLAMLVRRPLLIAQRLPFAYGIATAETVREMYARGAEALARLGVLLSMAGAASLLKLLTTYQWLKIFSERLVIERWSPAGLTIGGFPARSYTFALDPSLLMMGVGGLIGLRACVSLMLGAVLAYGVLGPHLVNQRYVSLTIDEKLAELPPGIELPHTATAGMSYDDVKRLLVWRGVMDSAERDAWLARSTDPDFLAAVERLHARSQLHARVNRSAQPNYNDLLQWLLWPGVTLMVVSSLVSFGLSWKSLLAAFRPPSASADALDDPGAAHAVPIRWGLMSLLIATVLSVWLQSYLFHIGWWVAILGVMLSFVLALVAARVSGETSVTPIGAMGKVTQLFFGFLVPRNPAPNLMAANVTGGAASQAADLLHDLKTGLLIGASPRYQFYAQILGALAGSLAGSAIYLYMIPNPRQQLLTDEWPAVAVAAWKAVAELFMVGLAALPRGTLTGVLVALVFAIALPIAEALAGKRGRWLVPSAASVGLAFVIPAYNAVSIFLGGVAAAVLSKLFPHWSARFLVSACAGAVAGESLTGVAVSIQKMLAPH